MLGRRILGALLALVIGTTAGIVPARGEQNTANEATLIEPAYEHPREYPYIERDNTRFAHDTYYQDPVLMLQPESFTSICNLIMLARKNNNEIINKLIDVYKLEQDMLKANHVHDTKVFSSITWQNKPNEDYKNEIKIDISKQLMHGDSIQFQQDAKNYSNKDIINIDNIYTNSYTLNYTTPLGKNGGYYINQIDKYIGSANVYIGWGEYYKVVHDIDSKIIEYIADLYSLGIKQHIIEAELLQTKSIRKLYDNGGNYGVMLPYIFNKYEVSDKVNKIEGGVTINNDNFSMSNLIEFRKNHAGNIVHTYDEQIKHYNTELISVKRDIATKQYELYALIGTNVSYINFFDLIDVDNYKVESINVSQLIKKHGIKEIQLVDYKYDSKTNAVEFNGDVYLLEGTSALINHDLPQVIYLNMGSRMLDESICDIPIIWIKPCVWDQILDNSYELQIARFKSAKSIMEYNKNINGSNDQYDLTFGFSGTSEESTLDKSLTDLNDYIFNIGIVYKNNAYIDNGITSEDANKSLLESLKEDNNEDFISNRLYCDYIGIMEKLRSSASILNSKQSEYSIQVDKLQRNSLSYLHTFFYDTESLISINTNIENSFESRNKLTEEIISTERQYIKSLLEAILLVGGFNS